MSVCQVIFPVALPDEGGFDWLDQFLESNPSFTEVSDRALLKWCERSGIHRPKGYGASARSSNDKPEASHFASLSTQCRYAQLCPATRSQTHAV
eukprot:g19855.t1